MRAILVATVLAATLLITPWRAGTPAHATTLAGKTVVYGFGGRCPPTHWSHPVVRPLRGSFTAPCELGVHRLRWKTWKRTAAFGHGVIVFTAGFTQRFHGTISLSVVRRHDGRRYFARMVLRWTTRNGRHHSLVLKWQRIRPFGWMWA